MPSSSPLTPLTWCRVLFQAWRLVMMERTVEALRTENARLERDAGKKADSIWSQNKADLVETARMELGIPRAQAEKETVATLREKIRSQRTVSEASADPMTQKPKGFTKMKLDELQAECNARSIPFADKATRPQLMVKINDDIERRLALMPSLVREDQQSSSSTRGARVNMRSSQSSGQEDEDWEMPQAKAATRRRQA